MNVIYEYAWSNIEFTIILIHKIIINWIIWPDQNWIRCRSAEAIGWNWLSSQNLNAHFSYPASNRIRRSIMQNLSWYILLHKTKKYLLHYCHHVPNSGISILQPCSHPSHPPPNVRRRNILNPARLDLPIMTRFLVKNNNIYLLPDRTQGFVGRRSLIYFLVFLRRE